MDEQAPRAYEVEPVTLRYVEEKNLYIKDFRKNVRMRRLFKDFGLFAALSTAFLINQQCPYTPTLESAYPSGVALTVRDGDGNLEERVSFVIDDTSITLDRTIRSQSARDINDYYTKLHSKKVYTSKKVGNMYSFAVTSSTIERDLLRLDSDENEYWFFNPIISLSIDGELSF